MRPLRLTPIAFRRQSKSSRVFRELFFLYFTPADPVIGDHRNQALLVGHNLLPGRFSRGAGKKGRGFGFDTGKVLLDA